MRRLSCRASASRVLPRQPPPPVPARGPGCGWATGRSRPARSLRWRAGGQPPRPRKWRSHRPHPQSRWRPGSCRPRRPSGRAGPGARVCARRPATSPRKNPPAPDRWLWATTQRRKSRMAAGSTASPLHPVYLWTTRVYLSAGRVRACRWVAAGCLWLWARGCLGEGGQGGCRCRAAISYCNKKAVRNNRPVVRSSAWWRLIPKFPRETETSAGQ